ncbi:aspartate racemase [Thozetella sp. PMI_491]|nr:aspartate racemase [Thozetella sp. PMI_491]
MKTIGFLGGMSYFSTGLYYAQINARVQAVRGGANAASLIMHSFNHAEMSRLFTQGRWDAVASKFIDAGRNMKAGGAQGLAIGCNIGHKVAQEVEAQVGLPLLHIADFTAREVKARRLKRIALLATRAAMEEDFLRTPLSQGAGVEVLVPGREARQAIDNAVFQELAMGEAREETSRQIRKIVRDLVDQGADGVVLACTDLQFVVRPDEMTVPVLDTLELHAKGLADWSLDE